MIIQKFIDIISPEYNGDGTLDSLIDFGLENNFICYTCVRDAVIRYDFEERKRTGSQSKTAIINQMEVDYNLGYSTIYYILNPEKKK